MKEVKKYFLDEEKRVIDDIEIYILLNGFQLVEFDNYKRDNNFGILKENDFEILREVEEGKYRYNCYEYRYNAVNVPGFKVLSIEYVFDKLRFDCIRFIYRLDIEDFPNGKIFYSIEEFKDFLVELL